MDFYIHSMISQKVIHLGKILREGSLFFIKFSFEWVYFEQQNLVDVLQYTLKNDTSRFSAYNNYYCHNTGRSFEPIFMKFTWLVRVHIWVNPIYLFFLKQSVQ